MRKISLFLFITVLCAGCRQSSDMPEVTNEVLSSHLPSKNYHYVTKLPFLIVEEKVYVPVYSDIYVINGERKYSLTVTLSIRNTSMKDSIFVSNADYYDSHGEKMRQYLEKPIVLKPLQSVELIVDYGEKEGGAGANFIVGWGAAKSVSRPIIQSIMIGSSNHQGISFVTEGVVIEKVSR